MLIHTFLKQTKFLFSHDISRSISHGMLLFGVSHELSHCLVFHMIFHMRFHMEFHTAWYFT